MKCLAALLVALLPCFGQAAANEVGQKFLDEYETKEGVIHLDSGLMYRVRHGGHKINATTWKEMAEMVNHPHPDSPCDVIFTGYQASEFPHGKLLDSSAHEGDKVQKPAKLVPKDMVMKGWTEVMQLMVEGDRWEVVIPPALGYGDKGNSELGVGPNDVLVYNIEMGQVQQGKPFSVCDVDTLEGCKETEKAYVTKMKDLGKMEVMHELTRLRGMWAEASNEFARRPERGTAMQWMQQRLVLLEKMKELKKLKKMGANQEGEGEEELDPDHIGDGGPHEDENEMPGMEDEPKQRKGKGRNGKGKGGPPRDQQEDGGEEPPNGDEPPPSDDEPISDEGAHYPNEEGESVEL